MASNRHGGSIVRKATFQSQGRFFGGSNFIKLASGRNHGYTTVSIAGAILWGEQHSVTGQPTTNLPGHVSIAGAILWGEQL